MKKGDFLYESYIKILREELVPAMGCTEPICLAYAASKARDVLGEKPLKVEVYASRNIIKNVKSVVVPNTDGLKGIAASVAAGVVAGATEKELECIANVTNEEKVEIADFLDDIPITVAPLSCKAQLEALVILYGETHSASVKVSEYHTNIVLIKKDDEVLYENTCYESKSGNLTDRSILSVADIYDFANSVDIEDIKPIIEPQIINNKAISQEGLRNPWGANIGKTILSMGEGVRYKARAWAAAGSDARMSGCEMPVIINSGSGNQGMTASLPVLAYADEYGIDEERVYRALTLSNLITIHEKTGIGRLSAYCGVVCAGCASAAGIAYLLGEDLDTISHTLINSLNIVSGIICDGAKPSCAGKIDAAVSAGLMGYEMYKQGNKFCCGEGLVGANVEETIERIGRLGREGMRKTDEEIIKIMVGN